MLAAARNRSPSRDGLPEASQSRAGSFVAALNEAVGGNGSVHRAGAGSDDPLNRDAPVFKQSIEHAPREGTMGTPALEGDVDRSPCCCSVGFEIVSHNCITCRLRRSQPGQPEALAIVQQTGPQTMAV